MTIVIIRQIFCALIILSSIGLAQSLRESEEYESKIYNPPAVFDLRDYDGENYVTSVKSQQGGTCWTHGTMASMESNLIMSGLWTAAGESGEPNLAEYHLDWWNGFNDHYNKDDNPPTTGIPLHQGGDYMVASAYFSRGDGAVRDSDGQSYSTPPLQYSPGYHYFYPRHIEFHVVGENYEYMDMIKSRIMEFGAIGTCMAWNSAFMRNDYTHYQPPSSSYEVNHSVAIVGWDDNKATAAPQPGAWLCKNSHGADWGFDGYFWLSYYDKYAGKHPEMGAVVFREVEPFRYDNVYYHDYHGMRDTLEGVTEAFNKFTAERTEFLNAVSFYTAKDSVNYTAIVYDEFDGSSLSQPLSQISGFVQYSGFHTYDLDSVVTLSQGNDFYLYLMLDTGGQPFDRTSEVPVLLGTESAHMVNSAANEDESYYKTAGAWQDFYFYDLSPWPQGTGNFCIKGLVTDTITSLTIGSVEMQQINQSAEIPLFAKNFFDVGEFSLAITFDPEVLTFTGLSNIINGETFSTTVNDSLLTIEWNGSGSTIDINHGTLCDLVFEYYTGSTDIDFVESQSTVYDKSGGAMVISYNNGSVTLNRSESLRYLKHTPGDFTLAIYNEGSIGTDNRTKNGPGITWKGTNGCFVGGPLFGTTQRGMTNGYLGSFGSVDNTLVNDIKNICSDFQSGFLQNTGFDQITEALLNDGSAPNPYGVEIIQRTYSSSGSEYVIIHYGFINTTGEPLNDFYSGMFIDWDIGNYENDMGGYDTEHDLVYVHGNELDKYFGTAALTGLSGMKITPEFGGLGNGIQLRQHSFDFISTLDTDPLQQSADLRSWQGTSLGTLPSNSADTLWACFVISAGDDLTMLKQHVADARLKAEQLGWVNVTSGTGEEQGLPQNYSLRQNYPNPFNPSTTIIFDLKEAGTVTLEVFNILGEKVRTLIDGSLEAGTHKATFDAGRLAGGIYLCRLTAEGSNGKAFTGTIKLMLLK